MITRRDLIRVTTSAALGSQIARLRQDVLAYSREIEAPRQSLPTDRSPLDLANELGLVLDPWQQKALATDLHHRVLLVTRQGGKGVVASLLAIDQALSVPGSKTLIGARTEEQAKRLFSRVKSAYLGLRQAPLVVTNKTVELELITGSRILAVPGAEESVRGIDAVDLLIVDEAALVPDSLYYAAFRPMLATTDGRQALFSTARGKRGFFYEMYEGGGPEWYRDKVVCYDIPRIKRSFLERERRDMGQWLFDQEYLCEFKDSEDQYFPTEYVHAALQPGLSPFLPTFGGAA